MLDETNSSYAGFWKRAAALFIDVMVVGIPAGIITLIIVPIVWKIPDTEQEWRIVKGISKILSGLAQLVYFPVMECSSKQGTLGKCFLE